MKSTVFLLCLFLEWNFSVIAEAGEPATPVGVWRVIGDKTGEPEALVQITDHGGVFEGKVIRIFPRLGVDSDALCELCTGSAKNQPVVGLTILTRLKKVGTEYKDGEILDPDTGELYRCNASMTNDNRHLLVRGFVGIPLLGRTQTWIREK